LIFPPTTTVRVSAGTNSIIYSNNLPLVSGFFYFFPAHLALLRKVSWAQSTIFTHMEQQSFDFHKRLALTLSPLLVVPPPPPFWMFLCAPFIAPCARSHISAPTFSCHAFKIASRLFSAVGKFCMKMQYIYRLLQTD
jgi:hypothetical protein